MKLYTKTGDDGSTGLFGGTRVRKDHPRVAAYGAVDELNAALGLAAAAAGTGTEVEGRIRSILVDLQSRLFDIGADLASPPATKHETKVVRITPDHVAEIEAAIDEIDAENEPMRHFVLPGGTELAARLHLARTVCRRAEREIVSLAEDETVSSALIVCVNRLSDLLFAMARRANHAAGVADV
ncbi:MAG: cob(I)yrinic acid a,c-diamide adenosyltransferase, partial [Phycisphaerales bacterium]|nr:cob(I)yrinic acid a,c-diamide adenosyltransferase [Phycisphaerales bacterium]